jgi:hypothetical protein
MYVLSRCDASCTQGWSVIHVDPNGNIAGYLVYNQQLTFGTNWTLQAISVDASAVPVGDSLSINSYGWSSAWTWQDIAFIGFQPINPSIPVIRSGTTGNIGGSALAAGQCVSGTASVPGATTSMVAIATPVVDPGDAFTWKAYVSAADTVTVKVCTNVASGGTPTASSYNVRVIQ